MSINETPYIDDWIEDKLRGDTGVGGLMHVGTTPGEEARVTDIWSEVVPSGESLPAIRFQLQAPADVSTRDHRVMLSALYLVAVVGEGASYWKLRKAADRIDTVLSKAEGETTDVIVLSCFREAPFRLPEQEGDRYYRHLGGLYRVLAHER